MVLPMSDDGRSATGAVTAAHAHLRRAAGHLRAGRGQPCCSTPTGGLPRLLSGLAVTSLGHAHPAVAEAVAAQARTLSHVSNLYGNELGPEVAAPSTG